MGDTRLDLGTLIWFGGSGRSQLGRIPALAGIPEGITFLSNEDNLIFIKYKLNIN